MVTPTVALLSSHRASLSNSLTTIPILQKKKIDQVPSPAPFHPERNRRLLTIIAPLRLRLLEGPYSFPTLWRQSQPMFLPLPNMHSHVPRRICIPGPRGPRQRQPHHTFLHKTFPGHQPPEFCLARVPRLGRDHNDRLRASRHERRQRAHQRRKCGGVVRALRYDDHVVDALGEPKGRSFILPV